MSEFNRGDVTFTDTNDDGDEETVTIPASLWEKIVANIVRIVVEQTGEMPTAYPGRAMVETAVMTMEFAPEARDLSMGKELFGPIIFHAHSPLGALERVHIEPPEFLPLLAASMGLTVEQAIDHLLSSGAQEVREYIGPEASDWVTSFKSEEELLAFLESGGEVPNLRTMGSKPTLEA